MEYLRDFIFETTLRIHCIDNNGDNSFGTGFYHVFNIDKGLNSGALCVVSNYHVFENATQIILTIPKRTPENTRDGINSVKLRIHSFKNLIIKHPTEDLAVLPLIPIFEYLSNNNLKPFYKFTSQQNIADSTYFADTFKTQDVYMVGYPNGLWDSKNNFPIVRKGICATPPNSQLNGLNQFLIDMHCFPGSSGSPIFGSDDGFYFSKSTNSITSGFRGALLGILFAGPIFSADGIVEMQEIPSISGKTTKSNIPMGLGLCIHATELNEFNALLDKSKVMDIEFLLDLKENF